MASLLSSDWTMAGIIILIRAKSKNQRTELLSFLINLEKASE